MRSRPPISRVRLQLFRNRYPFVPNLNHWPPVSVSVSQVQRTCPRPLVSVYQYLEVVVALGRHSVSRSSSFRACFACPAAIRSTNRLAYHFGWPRNIEVLFVNQVDEIMKQLGHWRGVDIAHLSPTLRHRLPRGLGGLQPGFMTHSGLALVHPTLALIPSLGHLYASK